MLSGGDLILTWKLKKCSRMILQLEHFYSSDFLKTKDAELSLRMNIGNSTSEDFIACFVSTNLNDKKILNKPNVSLELIGENCDIICSKRMNESRKFISFQIYECNELITKEKLRNYFAKSIKDEITLRCSIKGPKSLNENRINLVSYFWETNSSDLSHHHLVKEFSLCECFPFKFYLIKIENEILVIPDLIDKSVESYLNEFSIFDENFKCIGSWKIVSENHPPGIFKIKIYNEREYSTTKKIFIRCDIHVEDRELDPITEIVKINDGKKILNSDFDLSLHTDMKNMLIDKIHCDVELRVAGRQISAHKCILAARSPVFSAMFTRDMLEANSGLVDITDCEGEVFDAFLHFIYTGELNAADYQTVSGLLVTANKYQVRALTEKCSTILKSLLSAENLCEVLFIADLVDDAILKDSALTFIVDYSKEILKTSEWKKWVESHPDLANQVFIRLTEKFS